MGISVNNGDSDRQVCCSSSSTPTSRNAESTVTGVQWHLWTTTVYRVGHRADRRGYKQWVTNIDLPRDILHCWGVPWTYVAARSGLRPCQHVEPPLMFSSLAFDRSYYSGNPIVQPLRIHLELP
jgi:hypothetical protein